MDNHDALAWLSSLRLSRRRRRAIRRELHTHLLESQFDLISQGWEPDLAMRESLRRLGSPAELAEVFGRAGRRPWAARLALAGGLAAATLLGAYGAGGAFASNHGAHTSPPAHQVLRR